MNVTDYTYLMNKPDTITEKQADALGSVLNEFPYFQSARALRLKGLYNQNSFKYNYALKVTAAHTSDRSVLFDFITSESFTAIQNDFYEQKLRDLLEIKVFDSEIISPEQIQKVLEPKINPLEQSILNSIKEAETATSEKTIKTEEATNFSVNENASNVNQEVTNFTVEEPIKIDEQTIIQTTIEDASSTIKGERESFEESTKTEISKILPEIDPSIFLAIKEAQSVTYEKPIKIDEPKIIPEIDPSIFNVLKEAQSVTYEKPAAEEVSQITPIERSILSSIKVAETQDIEEKTEEPKIDSAIERSILNSIKESETVTFEEPSKVEEPKTEPIVEQAVSTPIEEEEDDSVIEEMTIPEFKMNPIERSILSSIKEAEAVVVEEIQEEIQEKIQEETQKEVREEAQEVQEELETETETEELSESAKTAEEHLEIGKPLDFSFNEKHSFQEWLQLSRTEPIDRSKDGPDESENNKKSDEIKNEEQSIIDERQKKAEIIDKFIENNPKISPIKPGNTAPVVQFESSSEDNSYLMTETLARVYLEQKKYTKAIQAYEILILKYPEKITFFADRISDIKILQQNNNNNN